jgi:hypothetical protein
LVIKLATYHSTSNKLVGRVQALSFPWSRLY